MAATRPSHSEATPGPSASVHPYLDWAIRTQFVYLRAGNWLPLLVEFDPATLPRIRGKTPLQVFTQLGWLSSTLKSAVRVPELFSNPPKRIREAASFRYCVLLIERKQAAVLVADRSWRGTIVRAELGPPVFLKGRQSKVSPTAETPASIGLKLALTGRVVMGVIDEGIAFAHSRFGTTATAATRIEYLWKQDSLAPGGWWFNSPGIELTAGSIKAALDVVRLGGGNEELAYRATKLLDFSREGFKPLARRRSHGTHVLDLAAGEDPALASTNRPIIAVDMPEEAVGDPTGATLQVHAAWGLVYILDRANAIRKEYERLPVVVNLSYGPHDGPHDGSSLFEQVADFLTILYRNSETPLRVVLAAGNFRQSRTHAGFSVKRSGTSTLQWQLQPGGLTPSFMEIWFPAGNASQVSVTLRSPSGQSINVSTGKPTDWLPNATNPLMGAQMLPATGGSSRASVLLTVARTAADPQVTGIQPVALSGRWTVTVHNGSAPTVPFDAWIRRTGTRGDRRAKGRQSYFDDPAYERFRSKTPCPTRPLEFNLSNAGYSKRQGTLSGIATGTTSDVIGGFRRGSQWKPNLHPAPYSSEGPHGNQQRTTRSPTCLFPSDDSLVCRGVLAAGNRSGSSVAMAGSSAAAPQAARWIADQWVLTGSEPVPPFAGLVAPIPDPFNPIPPGDIPLVVGDGLMPIPSNPNRPRR